MAKVKVFVQASHADTDADIDTGVMTAFIFGMCDPYDKTFITVP